MGPLTLLALLGVALGVGRAVRVPFAQAFFFTVAFVILALYFGALAGVLWWTALAVHVAGVTMLGLEALRRARQPAVIAVSVPIGMLGLLCAWFAVVHGADRYVGYDEFAHWGIFIKEMVALDGFWTGATNSMHPRYPPGAPLWQYLFNAFQDYSEGRTYFAHFVLLVAPLLMLWDNLHWRQAAWILAILAFLVLATANLGLGVSTIYVDQTIGVWYLGTLLAAFTDKNLASRRVVLYAAPLAVIALLKDAGLALAVSAALIIAAMVSVRMLGSRSARLAWKMGATLVVLLVPMLLCLTLWSWNRDAVGAAQDVQSVDGFLGGLTDRNAAGNSEVNTEIERRLEDVFLHLQLSNAAVSWEVNEFTYDMRPLFTDSYRLTTFGLLVLFPIWWAALARAALTRESRRRWLLVAGGVLITALVYVIALHYSYRFTFGSRGLDLPSYVRYVNVIALPMLLLSFCPFLPAFRDPDASPVWSVRRWSVDRNAAIYATALLTLYLAEPPHLAPIFEPNRESPGRAALEGVTAEIHKAVGESRLWVYYTGDSSHSTFSRIAMYLLTPTPTVFEPSARFFQTGDPASIGAVWGQFDYVWIASLLPPESVSTLARFDTGNATTGLFRVRVLRTGNVALEAVLPSGRAEQSTGRDTPRL